MMWKLQHACTSILGYIFVSLAQWSKVPDRWRGCAEALVSCESTMGQQWHGCVELWCRMPAWTSPVPPVMGVLMPCGLMPVD